MNSAIKTKVIEYLKKNPAPKDDKEFHKFAETVAKEHGIAEEAAYSIIGNLVAGGKSKGKIYNVDPKELEMGIQIEYEHTKDKEIAEKIARDHLFEIKDYYSRLAKMEKEADKPMKKAYINVYDNIYIKMNKAKGQDGEREQTGGTDYCVCPKCGHKQKHERGKECSLLKCPKCDIALTGEGTVGSTLQKAKGTHKYIDRKPHPSGKGFIYFYNQKQIKDYKEKGTIPGKKEEKSGGILSGIMSFFGFKSDKQAKEKVSSIYKENQSKLKGVSEPVFADYMNEYLSNKDKWDAKLKPKETKESEPKEEKEKKPETEKPKSEKKAGKSWNMSLMRTVAGIVGGGKEESDDFSKVKSARLKDKFEKMQGVLNTADRTGKEKDYAGLEKWMSDAKQAAEYGNEKLAQQLLSDINTVLNSFDSVANENEPAVDKLRKEVKDLKQSVDENKEKAEGLKNQKNLPKVKFKGDEDKYAYFEVDSWKENGKEYVRIVSDDKIDQFNKSDVSQQDDYSEVVEKSEMESVSSDSKDNFETMPEDNVGIDKFKIDDKLYKLNNKDLKNLSPEDFSNGSSLYITDSKTEKIKYIINLKKEKYDSYSMQSTVEDADTSKPLTTPGKGKGFRPYFIDDFLGKKEQSKVVKSAVMKEKDGNVYNSEKYKKKDGKYKLPGHGGLKHSNFKDPKEAKMFKDLKVSNAIFESQIKPVFDLGLEGQEQGVWTDGRILIIDKDVTKEIYDTNKSREFVRLKRSNPNKSDKEIGDSIDKTAKDTKFPDWKRVVPTSDETSKKKASLSDEYSKGKEGTNQQNLVKYSDGENEAIFQPDFVATIKNKFPDAVMYLNEKPTGPAVFKVGNEIKAVVMPVLNSTREFERLAKESKALREDILNEKIKKLSDETVKLAKTERDPKTGGMSQKYYDTLKKLNEAKKELNSSLDKKRTEKLNSPENKEQKKKDEAAQSLRDKTKKKEREVTSTTYERAKKRKENLVDSQMKLRKASQLLLSELKKAKEMPVGTISNGRKKMPDGKWLPVSQGKTGQKKEEKPAVDKKKDEKKAENPKREEMKQRLRDTLKKVATILSDALSGKDTVTPTGQAVEQAGDQAKQKKKQEPNKKEEKKIDPSKEKPQENQKKKVK